MIRYDTIMIRLNDKKGPVAMNGFERRTERKKQHILTCAHTMFKVQGVKDVNIMDLAKEADVSHVTIYHYFGNKKGLIDAVLDDTLDQKSLEANDIMLQEGAFESRLEALVRFEINRYEGYHPDFSKRLIEREKALLKRHPETIFEGLKSLLYQGRDEGRIQSDLSDDTLVMLVHMFRFLKSNDYLQNPQVVKEIFDLFRRGLGGRIVESK